MNQLTENFLEHHGIRGQRWGVRRFQNPDGSLTAAGRRRRNSDGQSSGQKSSKSQSGNFTQNFKKRGESIRTLSKETETIAGMASKRGQRKRRKLVRKEVTTMSNDELAKRVKRLKLENQYIDLMSTRLPKNGYDYLSDVLAVGGGAVVVTGSAVAITRELRRLTGRY